MSDSMPDNVIVLTQCGRFPSEADFAENPSLAIARLRTESLRLEAEAYTCLSLYLDSLVGAGTFDRARFVQLMRRFAEFRNLAVVAERAAATGAPEAPPVSASGAPGSRAQ